jgi:hypothetical protein
MWAPLGGSILLGPLRVPIGALRSPKGTPLGPIGKGQGRQKKVQCVLEKGRKEEKRIIGSFKNC